MRTRSFIATIIVLGLAAGMLINQFQSQKTPVTHALSSAGQTFNQIIVGFLDANEFTEYWHDFTRNTCQRDEIFRLHDKMDATRASLRAALYGTVVSAANTTVSSATESLESAISDSGVTPTETSVADPQIYLDEYKAEMIELYYLRNFVRSHEVPILGLPTSGSAVAADEDALYDDMYARFVDKTGWYTFDADFEPVFDALVAKYADEKEEFLNCGGWGNIASIDPEFKDIIDRYNKIRDTIIAFPSFLERAGETLSDTFAKESPPLGNKDADKGSIGTYFSEHFGFQLNGTCPRKGIAEIARDFNLLNNPYSDTQNTQTECTSVASTSEDTTEISSDTATLQQTAVLQAVYDDIYDLDYRLAFLTGKYETLYGTGADAAVDNLLKLLQYDDDDRTCTLDKLQSSCSLDTLIRFSIAQFQKLESCAATVNNKFCS